MYPSIAFVLGKECKIPPKELEVALASHYLTNPRAPEVVILKTEDARAPEELAASTFIEFAKRNPSVRFCVGVQGMTAPLQVNNETIERHSEFAMVQIAQGMIPLGLIHPDFKSGQELSSAQALIHCLHKEIRPIPHSVFLN